ncbi:hypothetical protein IX51_01005 [uncultured archaeon]|nr:hypothetical protein IX51_01005 [uncultured archaeon]
MTSPKIIRERQEESERNLGQHELLSAAYSLIQQNYGELQLSVKDVRIEEGYSRIKAVRTVSRSESNEFFYAYATTDDLEDAEGLRVKMENDRQDTSGSRDKVTSILIIADGKPLKRESTFDLFPVEMIWLISTEKSTARAMIKGETSDEFLKKLSSDEGMRIIGNFPHPYISQLDPLVKFAFISLNYARTGKASLPTILYESSAEAYAFSVGEEREMIRADFSELLQDLDKAGLITARANEIYFPKNSKKFQRSFIRRYWDYVEKLGKRTLFDFESPF